MEEPENRLTIKFIATKTEFGHFENSTNKNCSRNNKRWNYGESFAFSAAFEYPLSASAENSRNSHIFVVIYNAIVQVVGFSRAACLRNSPIRGREISCRSRFYCVAFELAATSFCFVSAFVSRKRLCVLCFAKSEQELVFRL